MYTEVARRACPQFRATQYVAGGAPGQHAQTVKSEKSNKNDRRYSVVPAPTTGAVPLQPVGAEVTRLLRALEITAYQSPKAYSEQERKVDMAPAAPHQAWQAGCRVGRSHQAGAAQADTSGGNGAI